jgi:hypothetical protein
MEKKKSCLITWSEIIDLLPVYLLFYSSESLGEISTIPLTEVGYLLSIIL